MSDVLTIATEDPSVSLRILATEADDVAYHDAVLEDTAHLSQYGDRTGKKYRTLEAVTKSRLNAGEKLRFGIWKGGEEFEGSINATPTEDKSEYEVGYWLRAGAQGHGYATMAVRALTAYLQDLPQAPRVFAEVHAQNDGSRHVLKRAGYYAVGMVMRDWGPALVMEPRQPQGTPG